MKKIKAKKLIYHFIWLFLVGAILGFIFETSWHFIKNGELINKQGLWYGPFKPIYGLGLVLITAILYKIKDKNPLLIFLVGLITGSLFEYLTSIFQEVVFGTYTWNYSSFNMNLNGRIYLPYCIVWGVISYIWMKYGFNLYLKIFNRYYNKKFRIISLIILVFMLYNSFISWVITDRYATRSKNFPPQNKLEEILDKYYPNEVIQKRFPKLRVK